MTAPGERQPIPFEKIVQIVLGPDQGIKGADVRRDLIRTRRIAEELATPGLDPRRAHLLRQQVAPEFRIYDDELGATIFDAVRESIHLGPGSPVQRRGIPTSQEHEAAPIVLPFRFVGRSVVWDSGTLAAQLSDSPPPSDPPDFESTKQPKTRKTRQGRERETAKRTSTQRPQRRREEKKHLIRECLRTGTASRKTIAERTGLNPSTVTRVTADMIDSGEIELGELIPKHTVGGGHEQLLVLIVTDPEVIEVERQADRSEHELGEVLARWGNDERKALEEIESEKVAPHRALLGQLLHFSLEHPELSLAKLFGRANTSAKRSRGNVQTRPPLTRYRIYKLLTQRTNGISQAELVNGLEQEYPEEYTMESRKSISAVIESLVRDKLISYRSVRSGIEYSYYQYSQDAPAGEVKVFKKRPTLTHAVLTILRSDPERAFSAADVYKIYIELNPDAADQKYLKDTIYAVLKHLKQNKYLQQGTLTSDRRSEISLTEGAGGQREPLQELVTIIDGYLKRDLDIVKMGIAYAEALPTNKRKAAALRKKAKQTSPDANRTPSATTEVRILRYLAIRVRSSNREIQAHLKEKYGQELTISSIKFITKKMAEGNDINSEKEGNTVFYSSKLAA